MYFKIDLDTIPTVRYIGHVSYNYPWSHFERSIDEFIMYIIESGDMFIQEDGIKYHLTSGDCFLLEPNKLHKGYADAPCTYYFVHFKHKGLQYTHECQSKIHSHLNSQRLKSISYDYLHESVATGYSSFLPKVFNMSSSHAFSRVSFTLTHAILDYNTRLEHYKLSSSLKLLDVFIIIAREFLSSVIQDEIKESSKVEFLTESILNFINREYQRKLTGKIFEDEFELNYDYMNRVFKKTTGHTIKNYVNVVRINKAKEILSITKCKINEAGYMVGIDDPYYFSRLFKKISGTTPLKYKKSLYIK